MEPWPSKAQLRPIFNLFQGHLNLAPPPAPEPKFLISPLTVLLMFEASSSRPSSHPERVWRASQVFLSLRGRRGGEAWPRSHVAKRLIRWKHLKFKPDADPPGLVVTVLTKTSSSPKEIFYPALPGCPLCPVACFTALKDGSPFPVSDEDPLFCPDGKPLKRSFIMNRTRSALAAARIPIDGAMGSKTWRAGTASRSVHVGLSEAITKHMGIWSSSAYMAYVRTTDHQTLSAVHAMVPASRTQASSHATGQPLNGEPDPDPPKPATAIPPCDCSIHGCTNSQSDPEFSNHCITCTNSLCTYCGECLWHVPNDRCPEHGGDSIAGSPHPAHTAATLPESSLASDSESSNSEVDWTSSDDDSAVPPAPLTTGTRQSTRLRSAHYRPSSYVFTDAAAFKGL